ncbi:hypothetical protein DXX93_04770 [Thalassotalea euphylliae]|uniref:Uncharacterized protein n=1 Tax=Thalassotalea euphylliae TaxID=1655234 RepID=A0A3E0TNS8_9GAMM|nr:hypothetical protein [Thalassotalea euphylliae]REL25940.1 hypothetical protein DXX93_04770 [Thalassotalea euphylliae]
MSDEQLEQAQMSSEQVAENDLLDQQWSTLVEDWQSQPYEKVDMTKLVKQLKKRTLAAKAILGFDVLATVSLFSILAHLFTEQESDWPSIIYIAFAAFGSLIYTIIEFKIRIKTWRMDASDPEQVFEKNISGVKGAIQYAKLWIVSCYLLAPVMNWYLWEVSKTQDDNMLPMFLFANGLLTVMVVGAYLYKRKRVKELENINKILNE